jgi:hypothetical protein
MATYWSQAMAVRRRHCVPPSTRTKNICVEQAYKEILPFWVQRSRSILDIVAVT